jgi:plastocyanin
MRHRTRSRVLATATLALVAACGGSETQVITPPPPVVASITIDGAGGTPMHSFGEQRSLTITARDGNQLPIANVQALWSSANPAIATVASATSATTTVTAIANGSTTVTARVGTVEATGTVTIAQQFAALALSPATLSLVVGASEHLLATARDALGNRDDGAGPIVFSSSAPDKVSVDSAGRLVARDVGSATITASLTQDGVTASALSTITVTAAPEFPSTASVTASSVGQSFAPRSVDIAAGGSVTWTFGSLMHNVAFNSAGSPQNIPGTTNSQVTRVFLTAGTYDYECQIHPGMTGTVVVH